MAIRRSGAAIVALLALICGCAPGGGGEAGEVERPIVLIGLDGFEWDVVLPLLADGELPQLAALMQRGSWGQLQTIRPTLSPIIWTSMATGVRQQRHGINGFTIDDKLIASSDRRVKAFWNVLTDYDKRVGVVGWWVTWPVEEVNGVMVAQVNVAAPGGGATKGALLEGIDRQVHPPEMQEEIVGMLTEASDSMEARIAEIFGRPWDPAIGELADRLHRNSLWSLRADELYRRVTLKLLAEQPPFDLFAVYFGGPDVLGHRFWRYLQPELYRRRPGAAELAALGDRIPAYYRHMDRVIGELVAAVPGDAVIVVVSDHGMGPVRTQGAYHAGLPIPQLTSGGHPRNVPAFFVAAGPGVRASGRLPQLRDDVPRVGSVLDLLPTLYALLDIPLADDFPGKVMESVLEPDWLAEHPPQRVESHTPPGWAEEHARSRTERFDTDERLEQLRSLGYIQ